MNDIEAWPPAAGLTTKLVPRSSAILTIPHSTNIHAPAALVFDTIINVLDYSKWNTWVPAVRIDSQPESSDDPNRLHIGTTMTFNVIMDASKPDKINATSLKVVDISTPSAPTSYLSPELLADPSFTADLSKVYRVSWTGHGGPYAFGMTLERFHEVIVLGENECEVRSWEIMGGMLARIVKMMMQDTLQEKVKLWCNDLKKRCEDVHAKSVSS